MNRRTKTPLEVLVSERITNSINDVIAEVHEFKTIAAERNEEKLVSNLSYIEESLVKAQLDMEKLVKEE